MGPIGVQQTRGGEAVENGVSSNGMSEKNL
jgi:hypothetical protein